MNKLTLFLACTGFVVITACGPKAAEKAKEFCVMYDNYHQAVKNNDTMKANEIMDKMTAFDKELTDKYMYKNPEWLMKYVRLKTACMTETEAKYSN